MCFFKKKIDILFKYYICNYIISFKKGFLFSNFALYDINYNKIQEFRKIFNKNFIKNFIRINCFQIAFFILFIKKIEKSFRFYINYRNFNIIIIKNRYFLFFILKTLNRFNYIKYFIKLNIISTFNRFRIRENNKLFIIFRTRFEFFKYFVIFFNLYNKFVLEFHYRTGII